MTDDHTHRGDDVHSVEAAMLADDGDDEIKRLKYRVKLLQHVIDTRPAKNASLSTAYGKWSDSIYKREFNGSLPAAPTKGE
jgi:hypothetical protein